MTLPPWYTQLLLAGQEAHAFVPRKQDNNCDRCGLAPEYEKHTENIQRRLAL